MIQGLMYMDSDDLVEVSRLAGLDDEKIKAAETREELVKAILNWMADVIGCSKGDDEAIERQVIEWMARKWEIKLKSSDTTPELEKQIRVCIAEESSRHLLPFWEVGCAMAYIGPEEAVTPKLELMQTAAARLVPSGSARQRLRQAWESKRKPGGNWEDVLASLKDDIQKVKADPDMIMSTLVLSLVVAMADGRFGTDEEYFYNSLAEQLGVTELDAANLQKRINGLYWEKTQELLQQVRKDKARTGKDETAQEEKFRALQAAHLTLETSGVLTALEGEVRSGFLGQLHKTMANDPAFRQGVRSWNKTPLMWPVGYAAGMCLYFKSRLRANEHPGLIKAVFLSLARQHTMASPDELKRESVGMVEVDDRSTDRKLLDSTVSKPKRESRAIKLERELEI